MSGVDVSLTASLAHDSAIARIRVVHCTPEHRCCGPIEQATVSTLVLPLRGVFVKHHDHRTHVVADVCHGVFFNAGEPYRVSHPVDGGDECLAIEPAADVLREIAGPLGEAAHRDKASFGCTDVLLTADLIIARKSLRHRLARRLANRLEADETALQLLAATAHAARIHRPAAQRERHRTRSRHAEIVESTKLALVSEPAQDWSLSALAKRVCSSPFHLARTFRRYAGLPLHRYQMMARLTAALDDVLDSSRELATVGVDLGFSSHSHFTAMFRSIFGTTPSTLRRSANQRDASEMRKILTAQRVPLS
jgi:AraC-like DNA-binding protein